MDLSAVYSWTAFRYAIIVHISPISWGEGIITGSNVINNGQDSGVIYKCERESPSFIKGRKQSQQPRCQLQRRPRFENIAP